MTFQTEKDTHAFDTEDASGSTSQAANVIESLEAGATVFLIDEDTSATNFMVRDELMQQVIHRIWSRSHLLLNECVIFTNSMESLQYW